MNKSILLILFLVINFGGLYLGNILMNNGPQTEWYINLNKAPWTPPGWVFGAAWTIIMVFFSIYLVLLYEEINLKVFSGLLLLEFILNVSWNYLFFNQHLTLLGLIILILLTLTIAYYFFNFKFNNLSYWRYLLLPYLIWLILATSLNTYVVLNN